jgi:uncharacterized membrane protein YedE/YeeE
MSRNVTALLIGLVFGLGLCVSGMTQPSKVLGFLDLAGLWDPSLAFVMGGAVAIGAVAFALAKRRPVSLMGKEIELPANRRIDARLVLGSVTFGIGWGLAGICPGPGIAVLGYGILQAAVFVAAMLAGMLIFEIGDRRSRQPAVPDDELGGLGAPSARAER